MARARKRRKKGNGSPPAKNTAASPASEDSAREQFLSIIAQDGYSNAAAFLGDDSPLLSAGTFVRSSLTRNIELLTSMYIALNADSGSGTKNTSFSESGFGMFRVRSFRIRKHIVTSSVVPNPEAEKPF